MKMKCLFKPALIVICGLALFACKNKSKPINKPTKNATDTTVQSINIVEVTQDKDITDVLDTAFNQFAFIASNKYIILSSTTDSTWAKGEPELITNDKGGDHASVCNVSADLIPASYRSFLNKKIIVCGSDRMSYTATISSLKLYTTIIPHYSQIQKWKGSQEDSTRPFTNKEIAADIQSSGHPLLVAEFTVDQQEKNTGDLFFAVPQNKSMPILFAFSPEAMANTNKQKIIPVLKQTKDYSVAQQQYIANGGNNKSYWWQDKETREESLAFFALNNKKGYEVMSQSAGEPCGEGFYVQKFSIWEVQENAAPVLQYMADGLYKTILATDIDGDNIPEFLIDDGFGNRLLVKQNKGKWAICYSWHIPYLDCPC